MTTNWETVTHEGETYKVLNDHAGNLTVTEWREQLEEYVEHMCDKTGIELLRGTAPYCTPRGDYSAEPLVTDDGRAMLIYLAQ